MIKKMKLLTLSIEGYRKFKEKVDIQFSEGINKIFADNASGKTTTYFALAWLITGQNFEGKRNELEIINDESEFAVVELKFEDETGAVRSLKRKLTKASQSIKLDDMTVSQKNLNNYIDATTFLSILNPLYFLDMDTNAMREFLQKHADVLLVEDVLNGMSKKDVDTIVLYLGKEVSSITHDDVLNAIDKMKNSIKASEKELVVQEGIIEKTNKELNSIVVQDIQPFDESSIIALRKEIEELEKTIPSIDAQKAKEFQAKRDNLRALQDLQADLESKLKKSIEEKQILSKQITDKESFNFSSKTTYELSDTVKEVTRLAGVYNGAKALSESLVQAINILKAVKDDTAQIVKPISILESLNAEQLSLMETTMTVGKKEKEKREMLKEKLAKEEAQFNKTKELDLEALKKKQVVISNEVSNNELAIKLFTDEHATNLLELMKEVSDSSFDKYLDDIEQRATQIKSVIQIKKSKVQLLEAEKKDIEIKIKQNASLVTLKTDKEQSLTNCSLKIDALKKEIEENSNVLNSFYAYQIARSEMSSKSVSKHFKDVSFVFEKFIKTTGDIKPCLEVFYQGKSLNKASTSQLIKTGIEISEVISKLSECEYPIIIDNAESITEYSLIGNGQVVEISVVKNAKLTIRTSDGTETLIEPKLVQQVA